MDAPAPPWDLLAKGDVEMAKLHDQADQLAFSEGRLSTRVKLLIAMALDATLGAESGVRYYASRAKESGATDEELFEAARVAALIGGTRAQTTALRGLEPVVAV